ncbi:MAG: CRTAC1 family protein [Planctomycetota bacterium]
MIRRVTDGGWRGLLVLLVVHAWAGVTHVAAQTGGAQIGGAQIEYVDVAEEAGISFQHTFGDEHLSSILEATGSGCAFFDYDNDGFMDLYLVNGCYLEGISDDESDEKGLTHTGSLYRNRRDGTFEDVTEKAGLAVQVFGMAVVAADYDNDGFTDLYLTNYYPGEKDRTEKKILEKNPDVVFRNLLFRNKGDGTFEDVTEKAGVATRHWSVGAVFFDFDRDSDLDLYVGNYLEFDSRYRLYYVADEFPGPLSYPGQRDFLYRNSDNGTFTDVSEKAGISLKGRAMGVSSADFDDDGDMDIYVSNDAMQNYLYTNNGNGTFADIGVESGAGFSAGGDSSSAMAAELGDFDLDGDLDFFVPDIKYKNLYRNLGNNLFEDATTETGVAEACGQFVAWGGGFLDFDNDGDLDLFVTNGSDHRLDTQENILLENVPGPEGMRVFKDVGPRHGKSFGHKNVGRGAAMGDYDNDGDIDIAVMTLDQPARLLRNDGENRNHWILIHLVGSKSNRDGAGARVIVQTGDLRQVRERTTADSYLSQNDPRLHFGLGSRTEIDRIVIRWPSGITQELKDIAADQILTVNEPEGK